MINTDCHTEINNIIVCLNLDDRKSNMSSDLAKTYVFRYMVFDVSVVQAYNAMLGIGLLIPKAPLWCCIAYGTMA